MSVKKRKPLDSAMEEFVFGTKEAAPTPAPLVMPAPSAAPQPTAPPTPAAALSAPSPPEPEASVSQSIPVQSKESSLTHRLQAPDKEATVRFTVDMSESLHRQLSMLAARTGRKKVDIVRMLLEEGLREVES
jgi:hypothetical protein